MAASIVLYVIIPLLTIAGVAGLWSLVSVVPDSLGCRLTGHERRLEAHQRRERAHYVAQTDALLARLDVEQRALKQAWRAHNQDVTFWVSQLSSDSPAVQRVAQLTLDYLSDQRKLMLKHDSVTPVAIPTFDLTQLVKESSHA